MTNLKCLTTKEVARLCRVSDATVKRWAEAGLLKSERTSGGHRRFRCDEVARFQREHRLGLKQTHGDESAQAALRLRRRTDRSVSTGSLFDSILAGREEETANLLINSYLHGRPLAQIFDEQICPAMRRIGQLWFDGEISIAQEHLATRAVFNAAYKLRSVMPVKEADTARLAFCCSPEGDFHELPVYLAQMSFEDEGWEVMNFGANTPLFSLIDEILYHAPEIVCISATIMTDQKQLACEYGHLRSRIARLNVPVILGGRAFEDAHVRQRFPAEFYAKSFSEISALARSLAF